MIRALPPIIATPCEYRPASPASPTMATSLPPIQSRCAADLRADQQAREETGAPIGRSAREQRARANLEECSRQLLRRFDARGQPGLEPGLAIGALQRPGERMPQHGMRAQDLEQLAGHGGREALHAPPAQLHPLGMGARHAHDAVEPGPKRPEAEQLRLLAPHDVLGAGGPLADARKDARREACGWHGRSDRSRYQGVEVGRRIEIGRLPPSLPSACHAADQHVDRRTARTEVAREQAAEDARVGVGRELAHALIGRAREHDFAARADPPRPQVGRAPIDGDPIGFVGHSALAGHGSAYLASVQLSENASALVLKGRPSRSRFQGLPAAWTPLRVKRAPRAGMRTVHTP